MTTEQSVEEQARLPGAEEAHLDIAALHSSVTDLEQKARAFIKQRPVAAVLVAVGTGYLVARLVARGRR